MSQASPSLLAGNRILLNNQAIPGGWVQWQVGTSRFGISDAALQLAGIELLNTEDVTQQPIQWFSQPTTNLLVLPTRLNRGLRYLDITRLAQQAGWQVRAIGNTLEIKTPAANVLSVRQGKQPWGDRLVLELDRPVTWQVEQQNQDLLVTIDAQVTPAIVQAFRPTASPLVQGVKLEPGQTQTQLRLSLSPNLRPRVWSLPSPNRLVIDIRPDGVTEQNILWAPGLRWRRQLLALGNDRFPVVWLEVAPRQPGLSIQPIVPNPTGMQGTAPLIQTAQTAQAVAAINGGFFNRNNQLPLGAVRRNNRWLSGPILNRGAIAWTPGGEVRIGRLMLEEAIVLSGNRFSITHLNSGYVQAGIARYTSDWGATYTPLTDNEIAVTIRNNQVAGQQSLGSVGSSSVPIPADGYLLVLRSNQSIAATFVPGTPIQLTSNTNPPEFNRYPEIVAAGPLLLQNRQIVLDPKVEQFSNAFAVERASRSAIGQNANGTWLIVAIHNRVGGAGASLTETAQLMQQLGALNALNLDGGSSTTLYLGGQLLDRSPRSAARVHNGIGVFIQSNP